MTKPLMFAACCLIGAAALHRADGVGADTQAKPAAAAPAAAAKPLLLEKNEGELRVRRVPTQSVGADVPSSEFTLKVGPRQNGSQELVAITEDLPPGASIVKHRHLDQDEIILIQTGTADVRVGDQQRTVHAGAMVFLPRNTFIEARNIGKEPISLVAIFSAPGFDEHLRCASVPAGQKPTPISREELTQCAHSGHAEFAIPGRGPGQ